MTSQLSDRSALVETIRDWVRHLKQPAYIGSNRCGACTLVNLVIVGVLTAFSSIVWLPLGLLVGVVGVLAVYLRGYLVPGTPELTKRYFPVWLLAWFGKATNADSEVAHIPEASQTAADEPRIDIEAFLRQEGAVTECEELDDLCVTDTFANEWKRAMIEIRTGETTVEAALAAIVDEDPSEISFSYAEDTPRVFASVSGVFAGQWVSEAALVADVAAGSVLAETAKSWNSVDARDRGAVLGALRVYLPTCPACNGVVGFHEDESGNCCWSTPVVVLQCAECDVPLLRLDQSAVAVNGDD